VIEVATPR
jgi:hypothetical protein